MSLGSRFLSSFQLTLGNQFLESVIHIDYDRYCYSYRIRRLFVFQKSIRTCFSHSSWAAFNKKSPKSRNRSTKKSLKIKRKNKKKFLGGGGQIYHIWTWPNLFILGFTISIFAHKKTTGKPVASKFKLNYSLTTLAACGPRAPSSTSN